MKRHVFLFWISIVLQLTFSLSSALSQGLFGEEEISSAKGPTLERAVLCKELTGCIPKNKAVIFSISYGKVICLTEFDRVPEYTTVLHKWFRKDILVTSIKLALEPPRWSTFSSIELRSADKGPWRVDVVDETGKVLAALRFSVTD
ncbi:MAG: DUF2914 domain-containing protein [Deltaproteobacteria bacterium]|nr:DUF2914 domain-containing protein [Deltaproteobacteria bacterium]